MERTILLMYLKMGFNLS